jgi:hypothetical protein
MKVIILINCRYVYIYMFFLFHLQIEKVLFIFIVNRLMFIVMNEVIGAFLDPKQLQLIFDGKLHMHVHSLRTILERVVLSSIMKLDANSMNKLFDLMIMMVKYQLDTATGPREVILLTLNHIDAVRSMAIDKTLHVHVDLAHQLLLSVSLSFFNFSL